MQGWFWQPDILYFPRMTPHVLPQCTPRRSVGRMGSKVTASPRGSPPPPVARQSFCQAAATMLWSTNRLSASVLHMKGRDRWTCGSPRHSACGHPPETRPELVEVACGGGDTERQRQARKRAESASGKIPSKIQTTPVCRFIPRWLIIVFCC